MIAKRENRRTGEQERQEKKREERDIEERESERDERSNFVREWRSSFEGSVNGCAGVDLGEASIR